MRDGTTHYVGCWRDRGHHDCAVDTAEELLMLLQAARWYVERSQHVTEIGRMKRDRDLSSIDRAIEAAGRMRG